MSARRLLLAPLTLLSCATAPGGGTSGGGTSAGTSGADQAADAAPTAST
jgi:hypothetical protein